MRRAPFFGESMRTSAPLWLWAAHFAFCYVVVAIGCDAGWHRIEWAGRSTLQWTLATASVAAIAAGAALLLAGWRHARDDAHRGLAARVRVLVAALSLTGIAWTAAPAVLLPACRFT